MNDFDPVITYVSPLRTARVRIPDTSEPASGSVRQNEASFGDSTSSPKYSRLTSSEPASSTGTLASPFAPSEVAIPEHPHASSSSIRQPPSAERPAPPSSSGTCVFISPSSCACSMISCGQVLSRSYSQATGRISFSANSCAISRMLFCSSASVKSIIVLLSLAPARPGARSGSSRLRSRTTHPSERIHHERGSAGCRAPCRRSWRSSRCGAGPGRAGQSEVPAGRPDRRSSRCVTTTSSTTPAS
jgi:hypothetical protein